MSENLPCLEPACEGHPQVTDISDGVRQVLNRPEVLEKPVYEGTGSVDGLGASIYGSVIRDGGVFRMWYQAWPGSGYSGSGDSLLVGCLESDDGIAWRRPRHGVLEWDGSLDNHLTDLPFHSPSVVIDPAAEPAARYRAFGCYKPLLAGGYGFNLPVSSPSSAYYTARSSDGLRWTVEGPDPAWTGADVITSVRDPWENNVFVSLKRGGRSAGMRRRRFCDATWAGGRPGKPVISLVPDETDDWFARGKGFESGDYYGLGLLPGKTVTIGFLWNFLHQPDPRAKKPGLLGRVGRVGCVSVSLVYQVGRGGRWQHLPGRPDWMSPLEMPRWAGGCLYTASYPVEVGDETWLYFSGTSDRHGWAGQEVDKREYRKEHRLARTGLARWTRGRLVGYESRLRGLVQLEPAGENSGEARLLLNLKARSGGRARVQLLDAVGKPIPGYDFDDCQPLEGDHAAAEVRWRGGTLKQAPAVARAVVELFETTLYGFLFETPAGPEKRP